MTDELLAEYRFDYREAKRNRFTAADIAEFPTNLPSGDVGWELFDGVPVATSPPGYIHSIVCGNMLRVLTGHGRATTRVGIVLRRNPDRVVGAHVAFLTSSQLPAAVTREGYLETIPALVVEVRSPNDTAAEVAAKAAEYLAAGVVVVWAADPETRAVTAYRTGRPPEVFAAADMLTVPDVIPGFTAAVGPLFDA